MDALECIHTRRSVRSFTDQPVSPEHIHELLSAAMTAPSACMQFPWEFVVLTDRDKLGQVGDINPFAKMAAKAPLAILVCADPAIESRCPGYWIQDCAAAAQNLLLAARALGLGAVWTAAYPDESRRAGYRKLLDIPERVEPVALVVIGHTDHAQERQNRFLEERVHTNGW